MVDITAPVPEGRQLISRYGDGGFVINGADYASIIFITQTETRTLDPDSPDGLIDTHFDMIAAEADRLNTVLLLGTGERMVHLSLPQRTRLREAGISVETMDTGAACRTFNVLQAEDRSACALLIPVP